MAVPNALVAWPIRFAATSYQLVVAIGGVTTTLSFPASGTLTVGRDYWMIDDSQADAVTVGGNGSLLTLLKATIDSHASANTATVTLTSDFKVNVAMSAGTVQILWDHGSTTLSKAIFGFAASTALASPVTGENVPYGIFRPGKPMAVDDRNRQPIVSGIARTMSGKPRFANLVTAPLKERDIKFEYLNKNVALTEYLEATNPTGSFEYFWINSASLGRTFRLYDDETSRTSTSYDLYQITDLEDQLRRMDSNRVLWWERPMTCVLRESP